MSTKVKTHIFHIDSDDDSEQESKQRFDDLIKMSATKNNNVYSLNGSHKLSNNIMTKGLFTKATEEDYQSVKTIEKPLHKSVSLMTRIKNKKPLENQELQQVESQPKNQPVAEVLVKPPNMAAVKKTKSLMFQLPSDSDDEIPSQQISQSKKELEKSIQKIVKEVVKQQKQQIDNEQEQYSQNHHDIGSKTVTPAQSNQEFDRKVWVNTIIPNKNVLQCQITKRNQISNLLLSQFDMYFRNYLVHTVSCKKFPGSMGSNYRISVDAQNFVYSSNKCVGKVRSIEGKDLYNVYSQGIKPERKKQQGPQTRQILASIRIHSGKGPRSLQVYVLKERCSYFNLLGHQLQIEPSLQMLYNIQQNKKSIHLFKNRKPEWIQKRQQYFLNFHGRISDKSIRNFILEDPQTEKEVMMFGKNTGGVYNIDISHPLTPMLGLAIAVPQLDRDD